MKTDKTVTEYFDKAEPWTEGLYIIRSILQETELEEQLKWGMPTYTLENKNVISLGAFKHHLSIWFHQGSFLSDPFNVLVNAQEGKTRGNRHIKYRSLEDIDLMMLHTYIAEAIQNQKDGKEIKVKRNTHKKTISPFMKQHLTPLALVNLNHLPPGKRNEFITYIDEAKRESTKMRRMQKINPMLESGIGMNDKYKR